MSELKIQGASLRSGHRWMSVDHTWLGNRTPCPSRDRGTFWMPRRVPEETAAYSMGWMPASSISLKTPCSGWHVPLPCFRSIFYSFLAPKRRGSRCVWHRSVQKSLSSSPNQICPSSIDPSAGPLAMSPLCYGPAHAQKLTCSCLTPWSYMRCRHKPARGSRT